MLDEAEVSEEDTREALRRPNDFGYMGDNDQMFVTWALGPVIRHRDSDCLQESNAAALEKHLESDPTLADDWTITGCGHWAVGWVDHLSYRAVEADGKTATRIARVLRAWFAALDDYPIADEDDFSRREQEEADRVWQDCYSPVERIEYIRRHRSQFEFHDWLDLLGCVRGKYFAGYASDLLLS
jgi:hypothetical protein